MTRHLLAVAFIALTVVSGCSTTYRTPGSESLASSDLAILEHPDPIASGVVIEDVDGKWRGLGIIKLYELTAGEHSVTARVSKGRYTSGKITRWFKPEPGRTYQLRTVVDTSAMRWGIAIVEKETQRRSDYGK